MLTAKGRDTDVDKGMGVGADAYMTKPFATQGPGGEGCRDAGHGDVRFERRMLLALLAPGLLLALFALIGGALLWSALDADAARDRCRR